MLKQKTLAFLAAQQRRQRLPGENQFCMYSGRSCMQPRSDGYDYCARHILEDKTAPFKQCQYMSARTSRRCSKIAKSEKKDSYCVEHARKSAQVRPRPTRRQGPRATPETLLEDLERHQAGNKQHGDTDIPARPPGNKPLGLQDFLSEEESDDDSRPLERTLKVDVESDDESIDSDQDDMLKHAGTYTAEEVALITREKLIRLQSLYIDQFKRLQHVLSEKRRRYLQNARPDREAVCLTAAKTDPAQRQQYDKLMALKRYHKSHGVEAILHRRSKERRMSQTDGARPKERSQKCTHTDDTVRCSRAALPLSKFCTTHILDDPHQVLFGACRFGEGACGRPVPLAPAVALKDGLVEPTCALHVPLGEYSDRVPDEAETMEEPGLDLSEEQALAQLARTLGDELETPDTSHGGHSRELGNSSQHMDEAGLDESLLCLDPDGVPTLEEAMMDTGLGLETNSEDLVMMLS